MSRKWISCRELSESRHPLGDCGHLSVVEGEVEEQLRDLTCGDTGVVIVNGGRIHRLEVGVVVDIGQQLRKLSVGADHLSRDSFHNVGGVEVSDKGHLVKESTEVADPRSFRLVRLTRRGRGSSRVGGWGRTQREGRRRRWLRS